MSGYAYSKLMYKNGEVIYGIIIADWESRKIKFSLLSVWASKSWLRVFSLYMWFQLFFNSSENSIVNLQMAF